MLTERPVSCARVRRSAPAGEAVRARLMPAAGMAVLALVTFVLALRSPAVALDKPAQIEALARAYHETLRFNGTVLVSEKGQVIFKKGFGLANREWNIPHAPDTKLRIGSLTKPFTALLVMRLVQERRIDLQGKLSAYLPYYRKDTGDKVTIHHLLTHSSGIPSYTEHPGILEEAVRDPYPVEDFVKTYCSGDLQFEPGTRFRYNNSGYFILGAVVEAVTGKSYADALGEKILEPLGMKNTGYDRPVPVLANRASGYVLTRDGYENARTLNMSLPFAAGALYSTVEDLYLLDRALAADKILAADARALLFRPHVVAGGGTSYGYGWMVRQVNVPGSKANTTSVFHGGAINGFSAYLERLPDEGHFVVVLSNTPEADLNELAAGIFNILYGQAYSLPKKPAMRENDGRSIESGPDRAIR